MRGWRALVVVLVLTAVFCGIGAWAFITWLTPLIIPTGAIWPGPTTLWVWLCIGGTIVGVLLGFSLDCSPLWTNQLPIMSDAGKAASIAGAAIGAAAAAWSLATVEAADPLAIGVVALVAACLAVMAWRAGRSTVRETRPHNRRVQRTKTLHQTGTRVRATVEEVDFDERWLLREPVFTVTARYDTPSGPQRATARLSTPPADAPVVGGTVLLWFSDDGDDSENIDIEHDPDSIRDPQSATIYQAPSDI